MTLDARPPDAGPGVVVGLSAVVAAVRGAELLTLTVRPDGGEVRSALPSGAFDPRGPPTFELALRDFVAEQTGFHLGYVEQLYTFGDEGRDVPAADPGQAARTGARVISVGYLALAAGVEDAAGAAWRAWPGFFPWEDWRRGRPPAHVALEPALRAWSRGAPARAARVASLFALDGLRWNEERVLERYETLYEAGLAAEARRDRAEPPLPPDLAAATGEAMASDHRRILATGLGRLRGKLKYRPVVFDLLGASFTLSELQRTVEAVAGVLLHKQNFRRTVERTGLVEELGEIEAATGGRPARRFRFRRAEAALAPAVGLSLPLLPDG